MRILDAYPVIVTDAIADCRDMYVAWFGFDVTFEASWFVLLSRADPHPVSIAFMRPDHPSVPPSPAAHRGDGSFLTVQVDDAAAEHDRLRGAGVAIELGLTDEPWGQRRFAIIDPAGVWVDIVEQIEPIEGWWDPYVPGD